MRTLNTTVATLLFAAAVLVGPAVPAHAAGTVGSGTPASCSFAALKNAITSGGVVTFNCGDAPHTISFAETIEIQNTVEIDGGGTITLNGNNRQLFLQRSFDRTASSLTLRNLTITGGRASGAGEAANGGAIRSVNNSFDGKSFPPVLTIENVTFSDNDTNLTSFSGGDAYDFGGGAIFSLGGRVVIKNSVFRDNDAINSAGGAVHILQSALSVENSSFTNNTALGKTPADSLGGAIYIDGLGVTDPNSTFTLSNSVFENNRAYNAGGAIYINTYQNTNSLVVQQTRFSNNAVVAGNRAQGGAIGGGGTNSSLRVAISRSLFNGNTAKSSNDPFDGSGGALSFAQPSVLRIENSTFEGNRAEGGSFNANGGALYIVNHPTPFEITSSTFANNVAGWVGGAISSSETGGSVRNTLFSNNTATGIANFQQHCSNELADGGGNFQFPGRLTDGNFFNDVTCFKGKSSPDQKNDPVFRDPKLAALADNGGSTPTMALGFDSPALDAAAGNCPATDQRGISRPQGAKCDSGAFELVQKLSAAPSVISREDGTVTLTVRGAGFTANSKISVGGIERATSFVDAGTLTAQLNVVDLAVGTLEVTVSGSALGAAQISVVERVLRVYLPLLKRL